MLIYEVQIVSEDKMDDLFLSLKITYLSEEMVCISMIYCGNSHESKWYMIIVSAIIKINGIMILFIIIKSFMTDLLYVLQ